MSTHGIPDITAETKITASLFEAGLKCLTKCFLLSRGERGSDNGYANWAQLRNEAYQREAIERLAAGKESVKCATGRADARNLMEGEWRLATNVTAQAHNMESTISMVERVSSGQGKTVQHVPMRFIYTNKLARDDKLLVGFDTLVLSGMLGRSIDVGKIVHGDGYVQATVKTGLLTSEVRKIAANISMVLSSKSPPELVLQRHCNECQFEARCRENAKAKEDLSLLTGMSQRERKELNSKGIFTITHLSYTFRPRRRPKRFARRAERYHHSLKALAIRQGKVHVVGSEELKITRTPVYIDVEGLPDRDFYYLVGLRIGTGPATVQHSLWADTQEDEERVWHQLLERRLGGSRSRPDPLWWLRGSFFQTNADAIR